MKITKYKASEYIIPTRVFNSISNNIKDLKHNQRYNSIIEELDKDGRLNEIGFKLEKNNLYAGVTLNPDLLKYTDPESQESVELKFVSEKMKKYTNFLQSEGILDSIKADYDRIYDKKDFYGYVVQISYRKNRNISKLIYDCIYTSVLLPIIGFGLYYLVINIV
jgi:hypothetical protein